MSTNRIHLRYTSKVFHGEFDLKIWVRCDSILLSVQLVFHRPSPACISGAYFLHLGHCLVVLVHHSIFSVLPAYDPDVRMSCEFQLRTHRI